MRGVAGKDDALMDEAREAAALKAVDRNPFELEIGMAEHAADAWDDPLGTALIVGIGIGAELKVDAPDVVRLLVQQRRLSGVERRVEPEPAFGRECSRHFDVGDQKPILECFALERETQHVATRRTCAVAAHEPVAAQTIGTFRRFDRNRRSVGALLDACHAVAPSEIDGFVFHDGAGKLLLHVVLLQVDEGRHLVPALGQQVELVDLAVGEEHPALVPDDAFFQHAVGDAEFDRRSRAFASTSRCRGCPRRCGRRRRAGPWRDHARRDRAPASCRPARRRPRSRDDGPAWRGPGRSIGSSRTGQ